MTRMYNNKKGFIPGWIYIVGFFILALTFVFVVGVYDFYLVEFFNPVSELLINETIARSGNSSDVVIAMQENVVRANTLTLPFNLMFMFIFFVSVMVSLVSVAKSTKRDPINLLYETVGGIIFLIFLIKIAIIKLLEYFELEIIQAIFGDLVNEYVPFYATILDSWGITVLVWGLALVLSNWIFGKEESSR